MARLVRSSHGALGRIFSLVRLTTARLWKSAGAKSAEGPEHVILDTLTSDDIRNLIFGNNAAVQRRFRELFGAKIDGAIAALTSAHSELQGLQSRVALERRTADVQMFLHVAINSMIVSLHHLVSGYPISSGHAMRHYTEAIAMALMCSDEGTGIYARYSADPRVFPIHKAPEMLLKKGIKKSLAKSLRFDPDAWEKILRINKLYDQSSHVSRLALGHQVEGMIIGSEFDPTKADLYRLDVARRRGAAVSLAHFLPIIMNILPKRPTPTKQEAE